MSTDREQRKARMAAAATRRARPEATLTGPTEIVRVKPIRITIDLDPEDYRRLTAWTAKAAVELDVPRVTAADAIRAMVRVAALDSGISGVVTDQLRRTREQ